MKCAICRKRLTCKTCNTMLEPYGECLGCGKYHCMPCTNDILEDTGELCSCQLPPNVKYIHNKQRFARIQRYLSSKIFKYFGEKLVSLKFFLNKIGEKL